MSWLGRRVFTLHDGVVDARAYWFLRVGLAVVVLLRITTAGGDWLTFDHALWAEPVEWWSDTEVQHPGLRLPIFVAISPVVDRALLVLRLLAAATMLLGFWPRLSCAWVGSTGLLLMNADQFRYFHHLHLLYLACLLLALCPSGWKGPPLRSRWPLQLVRFQLLLVYAAAGLAKCNDAWLSGATLLQLSQLGLVRVGGFFGQANAPYFATAIAVSELLVVPLLAWRRTRWAGVVVASSLHLGFDLLMTVSTFGITMVLLLSAFLPVWTEDDSRSLSDRVFWGGSRA